MRKTYEVGDQVRLYDRDNNNAETVGWVVGQGAGFIAVSSGGPIRDVWLTDIIENVTATGIFDSAKTIHRDEPGQWHFASDEEKQDLLQLWLTRKEAIELIRSLAVFLQWEDERGSFGFMGKMEWKPDD